MKNKHRDSITDLFQNIRKTTKTAQRDMERVYKNAKRRAEETNFSKYTPEYQQEWRTKEKEKVNVDVGSIKNVATFQVGSLFGLIRDEVRAWSQEPAPAELLETLNCYRTYNITPSLEELKSFQEMAQGSFIGTKIVNNLAESVGVYDTSYAELGDIMKDLRQAEADIKSSIVNYAGQYDEGTRHYTGDQYAEDTNAKWFLIPFAADFLEREDTSLSRVENLLSVLTEDTFDILPSKRQELDETFKDADDPQRVEIAKSLINTKASLADLLEKYDKDLFRMALESIADDTQAIARQAVRDYEDAIAEAREAVQASSAATQAADRAAGLYTI